MFFGKSGQTKSFVRLDTVTIDSICLACDKSAHGQETCLATIRGSNAAQLYHGEKAAKAASARNVIFTAGTWKRAENTTTKAWKMIGSVSWAGAAGANSRLLWKGRGAESCHATEPRSESQTPIS